MASAYYYLIASLPELELPSTPPITRDDFMARCREEISEREFETLESIELTPVDGLSAPSVVHEWWAWEHSLRGSLARLRAQRLERSLEGRAAAGIDRSDAADLARKAFEIRNPEEAEALLTRGRWRALDAIGAFVYFGFPQLTLYRLRLAILERREEFRYEIGRQRFGAIVERARLEARQQFQSVGGEEWDK